MTVKRLTLIAFVPSEFQGSEEEGAIEGAVHLRFAVEDTLKCVHPLSPTIHLLYADIILVKNGPKTDRVPAYQFGQAVKPLRAGELYVMPHELPLR